MQANQIFQETSPELAIEILTAVREEDRNVYKATLASLAGQKKLRPVFVQRKPVDQQMRWMHGTLKLKSCSEIGEQLLQMWLLTCHSDMLVQFLDDLRIEHDGKGAVNELPESLDRDRLAKAVDHLFKRFPQAEISIYLRLFQMQRPGGWDELGAILDADERLATAPEPAETPKSAPHAPQDQSASG